MSRPINAESPFRAVAHPTRRRMLQLLSRRPWSATELAAQFHHAQPTLSKHLRDLNRAGLVSHRREGRQFIYELVPGCLESIRRWLQSVPAAANRH